MVYLKGMGPAQFIMYISALESCFLSKESKFADDTKLDGTALCSDACRKIKIRPRTNLEFKVKIGNALKCSREMHGFVH